MTSPMRYQPQFLARVNTRNQCAQGIVSLVNPGISRDVVRDNNTILAANATITGSTRGKVFKGASTNAAIDIGTNGGLNTLAPTTSAVSWFALINVTVTGVRQCLCGDFDSGGINESFNAEITAANAWRVYSVNTSPLAVEVSGGTVTTGWHVIEVELTANNFTLSVWVDGVLIGTTNSGSPRRSGVALRLMSFGTFTNSSFQGQMALSVFWNRTRTSAERTSLISNPWQLFETPDNWDESPANSIVTSNGSSSGLSAVAAVVNAIWGITGASIGTSTISSTTNSVSTTLASSQGTSTVDNNALSISQSSGSSSGSATLTSMANAIANALGSSSGAALCDSQSNSISTTSGSCSGIATTTTATKSIWQVIGSSNGVSNASTSPNSIWNVVGSSTGISSVGSSTNAIFVVVGSSSGTSTANGNTTASTYSSVDGSAIGTSSVSALSNAIISATGASVCSSNINSVVLSIANSNGSSLGTSAASVVTQAIAAVVGNSVGTSSVNGRTDGGIVYIEAGDRLSVAIVTEQYVMQLIDKMTITLY